LAKSFLLERAGFDRPDFCNYLQNAAARVKRLFPR
jgi:hypothetical protein